VRFAVALAASAALLFGAAQPVSAAPSVTVGITPRTVVVGQGGTGTNTTFFATGVPSSIRALDLDLYAPDGGRAMIDLALRNRPGVWEGEYRFNRFEAFGKWKAVLTMRDKAGRASKGGTTYFYVKRRTTLSSASSKARGKGISGVLRRMANNGKYAPYAGQKVSLYRWNGTWKYVTTDVTDAKGKYSFKSPGGKLQIRYAGNAVNAVAVRTVN
jgi:hypothetical protein